MLDDSSSPSGSVGRSAPGLPDPLSVPAPWLDHFPRGVPESYAVPDVPLTRLLDDAVQDFPDSVAITAHGRRWTYHQLLDQVDRFASALARLGVAPGEHVGIALPNVPQAVVAAFATWRLGAVLAVFDHTADSQEIAQQLRRLSGRILVATEQRAEDREELGIPHLLLTGAEDVLPFPRNVAVAARRTLRRRSRGGHRMMELVRRSIPMTPSEGGKAAAAVLCDAGEPTHFSHPQLLAAAFHLRLWIPDVVAGSERILSAVPLHSPLGLTAAITMPTLAAGTLVLATGQDTASLARAVDRARPTILVLDPDRLSSVIGALRTDAQDLRICLQTGTVDRDAAAGVEERIGARVRGVWSPAGAAGVVVADPIYGLTKPTSAGIPVTDTRAMVVDPTVATACSPGQVGEIIVAGPQVQHRAGLHLQGAETSRSPGDTSHPAGWLRTGVRGSMDADGFVTLNLPPPSQGSET